MLLPLASQSHQHKAHIPRLRDSQSFNESLNVPTSLLRNAIRHDDTNSLILNRIDTQEHLVSHRVAEGVPFTVLIAHWFDGVDGVHPGVGRDEAGVLWETSLEGPGHGVFSNAWVAVDED